MVAENTSERLVYTTTFADEYAHPIEGMPEHLTTMIFTEEDGKTRVTARVEFSSAEALKIAIDLGMLQGIAMTWDYLIEYGQELQAKERKAIMGNVLFGLSASLDGFIAGKNDDVSEVFAWFGNTMEHFSEVVGEAMNEVGAVIMGHRSFDMIYGEQGWVMPDGTPIPGPVVVMQSQAREAETKGLSHFHFVTDGIESAIAKARELAGGKNVALHGASSVQQALKAGLLDEFHLSVAHVLLGEGVRLFDHLGTSPIHLEHIRTRETPGATHLSFRVVK